MSMSITTTPDEAVEKFRKSGYNLNPWEEELIRLYAKQNKSYKEDIKLRLMMMGVEEKSAEIISERWSKQDLLTVDRLIDLTRSIFRSHVMISARGSGKSFRGISLPTTFMDEKIPEALRKNIYARVTVDEVLDYALWYTKRPVIMMSPEEWRARYVS